MNLTPSVSSNYLVSKLSVLRLSEYVTLSPSSQACPPGFVESRLVDCNSETGSDPAGRKIVTVTDSLGLESFTIPVTSNITVTGH
jgi:hypothetical protein